MSDTYQKVALGGTFDRLHRGHKHLLSSAFSVADEVHIGITTHALTQSKPHTHSILPFNQRKQELLEFISHMGWQGRYTTQRLNDIYGNTLTDNQIEAIVVTPHTKAGALNVNKARQAKNLSPLPIITTSLIKDDSDLYISSTRIRQGIINRQGKLYKDLFSKEIILTKHQKKFLSSPQAAIYTKASNVRNIIDACQGPTAVVGDYATQWLLDNKLKFNYTIVDGHNQRKRFQIDFKDWLPRTSSKLTNPAGTIQASLAKSIAQMLTKSTGRITIDGEEDLAALPLALLMPLQSLLMYGQPERGLVIMTINEAQKHKYTKLLQQ